MSKLQLPLKTLLRDETPAPAALQRWWSAIDERLPAPRPPRRGRLALSATALPLASALVAVLWLHHGAATSGPLRLASGGELSTLESTGGARGVTLEDGSRIALEDGGSLEPLSNDAREVALLLRRGRARFAVQPSARRWTLETGLASLQVSGARFAVWRHDDSVDVQVYTGALVVRSELIPGAVRKLDAGQSLRVAASERAAVAPPPAAVPMSRVPAAGALVEPTRPSRHRSERAASPAATTAEPSWRALADDQRSQRAYAALGEAGWARTVSRAPTLDDLLLLADIARLSGHARDALAPLQRAGRDFADDRRAAIAAFTCGRIHADELQEPRHAAESFARALELGLPESLTEAARYRLVEALEHGGEHERARAAAADYRQRHPQGRFSGAIERLVGAP